MFIRSFWKVAVLGLVGSAGSRAAAQWNLVPTEVTVPASMRWSPFDVSRTLNVPPNVAVDVVARVGGARFLAVAPNGDILVSQPYAGNVVLIRPRPGQDPDYYTFANGLNLPHDIVFHKIGSTTYVYISETNRVARYSYTSGDTTGRNREVLVSGLPDASLPELRGSYGHALKNIALDADHRLYVSIASSSNAWSGDAVSDPVRCAIYRYNADGTNRTLFARGLRNAEGLAFLPGTTDLWAAVNNRDNVPYPYQDATGWYGQVLGQYVDNHPPDEFTRVAFGANYGWPFANPNPDSLNGLDYPPFDPDYDNNRDWSQYGVNTFQRVSKGIPAHSAALGLTFWQGTAAPAAWRNGATIALHGSWNRSRRTGYKVVYFPWNGETQGPLTQTDFVTGWLDEASQGQWGRPVDTAVDLDGNILISDDDSGTIYRLKPTLGTDTSRAVASVDAVTGDVNLADARTQDWRIWSAPRQKADAPINGISEYGLIGETNVTAENGTRTISIETTKTRKRLAAGGVKNGFTFSVPADSGLRTLRVWLGTKSTVGKLTLKLSDSANETVVRTKGLPYTYEGVATIRYRASGPGQRLTVNWTVSSGGGSVFIQAAAITGTRK